MALLLPKVLWVLHSWQPTCFPAPSLTCLCLYIRCQSEVRSPLPSVQSFQSIGTCWEWLWSSVPHLCPSEQGYLEMGWSKQSTGLVQLEWVGISSECGLWQKSGHRVASERCGKPHLQCSFDPSGLQGGTSLLGPCLKVF